MSAERNFIPRAPIVPTIMPIACPVRASLGVLGRKWALLILRDVAFYRNVRFSDLLRSNHGLTPRVLSFRLRELRSEGFVKRIMRKGNNRDVFYDLTQKGWDAVPILTAFTNFGFRYHAEVVFKDHKPRTIRDVLPGAQRQLLGELAEYARDMKSVSPGHETIQRASRRRRNNS